MGSKGKSHGKGKDLSGETLDLKDCPLRLPEFAEIDHSKVVPRFSSVLRRSDQDGIGLEDVDPLQLELEALLSASVVRKMTLKEEIKILSNIEKYKGQARLLKKGPGSPGKRGTSGKDVRSSAKKLKSLSGKPIEAAKVIGLPKLKSETSVPSFDPLQNEQIRPVAETSKPSAPKNETPNRFWSFVEPYCAPITPDDIKLLEDLISTHNDMSEYLRVPKLGQHYAQRWAKEDLENERVKGASNSDGNSAGNDNGKMLKKANDALNSEDSPFGELTQRLVAGLMEENLITPIEETLELGKKGVEPDSGNENAKGQLIKSLNIRNAEALEARVRKELEEQGILDPNDEEMNNGDAVKENDEIYDELVRCQSELKSISSHNLMQLRRLLKAAKEEMVRQELRNRLQEADLEVMEAYKKISSARSKKKSPSKKEREQAWKALKDREVILKNLENV